MPRIKTRDGVELYVKDWGEGRPVVFLHGWPLTADTFDDLSKAIADAGMRAISYDRRGFGRSEQPFDGYNYDTLSDDLADVMSWAGATDATILGFSMGGGEVARYMSRHGGDNLRSAILVSSVVPYMLKTEDNPQGTPQETFDEMTKGMVEDRAHFFASFFKDFFGVAMFDKAVSDEMLEWAERQAMMAGLEPTLACAKAFATTDFRPDLASFNVPTLVIHGTDDKTVPIDAAGRAAAKGIAQSTLIEYEGAPHGLFATHKQRFIEDVVNFLRR